MKEILPNMTRDKSKFTWIIVLGDSSDALSDSGKIPLLPSGLSSEDGDGEISKPSPL